MRWLNPTLLYFAALAVVPLLLHFLLRERVQRVAFSAVRFLRQHGREALSRRRWLEWLLTAVRIACVLILAVAFARPFFPSGETGPKGAERELLVVLLDVSRSMTFGSRFDDARSAAERIVSRAGDGKELKIVTFADEATIALHSAQDPADALDLLRRARPTAFGTDILSALDRVFATIGRPLPAMGARRAGGEVHLISDLQACGIARNRDIRRLPKGFQFHVHAIGGDAPADSVAVAGSALPTEVTPEASNLSVSARVINRGNAREAEAQLLLDGKALTSRRLALPQNGEAVVSLTGTIREAGDHAGQVVVKGVPVALEGDDRVHFVVRVVNRIRVAVVNGRPSAAPADDAAFYLVKALNAGQDAPLEAKAHPSLPPLGEIDVVVLAGVGALPPADLERLGEFVRNGGGLLIGLGPGLEPEAFNSSIGRLAPARLRAWKSGERASFLSALDLKHPLVQRLASEGGGDLTTARFHGSWELKDSQDARVVARFDDNRPALLEKHEGQGTVLLFAAALDRRGGDFPLRAIFLPFVREAAKLLSARGERSALLALGETLPLSADSVVECPDGSTLRGGGAEGTSCVVSQPGVYRVKSKGKTELYAANVNPAESDLTSAAASDVEGLVSVEKDFVVRRTARGYELVLATEEKLKAERRWSIGWWCLIALLGLCAAELWLAQLASRK
jgi:hypothetical protein